MIEINDDLVPIDQFLVSYKMIFEGTKNTNSAFL